jgi:hypothetical protein
VALNADLYMLLLAFAELKFKWPIHVTPIISLWL